MRGKLKNTADIRVEANTVIKELGQEWIYKYLGINEGDDGLENAAIKEKIKKEYCRGIRMV